MKKRIIGTLLAIACIALLASCALIGNDSTNQTRIIRAEDGLNLVCEVRGSGDTALVFLHGWGGDRHYWKHQVDVFAADYRVVTLDQAGFGESGKARTSWSVEGLAADVESVVTALRLDRVILIGHSMGGAVALMAAKRMPDRVIGVVGVDTLQNAEARMAEDMRQTLLAEFNTNFAGMVQGMIPALLPETADPDLKSWLTTKAVAQDPAVALALFRDLTALDPVPVYKEVKVPVRCINSAGGFALFSPTAIGINRKYSDYDAVLIPDVGHYPMLEKPGEFNRKLSDVLKEFERRKIAR